MENLSRVRDLSQIRIGSLALAYVRSRRPRRDNRTRAKISDHNFAIGRRDRVHARRESMAADIDCQTSIPRAVCQRESRFFCRRSKLRGGLQSRLQNAYDALRAFEVGQRHRPLLATVLRVKGGSMRFAINNRVRSRLFESCPIIPP